MTILFDATQTRKVNRRFGTGILRSVPTYRAPYTLSDAEWAAAEFAAEDFDAAMEERYVESAMLDRYERGNLPL